MGISQCLKCSTLQFDLKCVYFSSITEIAYCCNTCIIICLINGNHDRWLHYITCDFPDVHVFNTQVWEYCNLYSRGSHLKLYYFIYVDGTKSYLFCHKNKEIQYIKARFRLLSVISLELRLITLLCFYNAFWQCLPRLLISFSLVNSSHKETTNFRI